MIKIITMIRKLSEERVRKDASMITVIIECDNCGKRIEKKYSWITDFGSDDLRIFYTNQSFSNDYLNIDVCPNCKEKFEDITFRE